MSNGILWFPRFYIYLNIILKFFFFFRWYLCSPGWYVCFNFMWKFQIYWQQISALSFPDFLENVNFLCISRSWVQSEEEAILWRKGFPTKDFATFDSGIPNVDAHQQQTQIMKIQIQIQKLKPVLLVSLTSSWQNCNFTKDFYIYFSHNMFRVLASCSCGGYR